MLEGNACVITEITNTNNKKKRNKHYENERFSRKIDLNTNVVATYPVEITSLFDGSHYFVTKLLFYLTDEILDKEHEEFTHIVINEEGCMFWSKQKVKPLFIEDNSVDRSLRYYRIYYDAEVKILKSMWQTFKS